MFWSIFSIIIFTFLGFCSGVMCEEALHEKRYSGAVFFGLCAIAGALFASTVGIISFLMYHENLTAELAQKILALF
jgi:hypothetical protein